MIFRHFWLFIVAAGALLVPAYWNPNISVATSLVIGFVSVMVLRQLAIRWSLLSTRQRIVSLSMVGGLIAGVTIGLLIGWNGGPAGSPVLEIYGRRIHFSAVGFPLQFGLVGAVAGLLCGFAWAGMTASERRFVHERPLGYQIPDPKKMILDRSTAVAALTYEEEYARDAAARYLGLEAMQGKPYLPALGPLSLVAKRELDEFPRGGRRRALPMSTASVAIMKIIEAKKLNLDWSASLADLKSSLEKTVDGDSDVVVREDAQKYLANWAWIEKR